MLTRQDLFNNSHVGVFLRVSEALHFYPPGLTEKEIKVLESTLECPGVKLTLGGGRVLGSNMVCNDTGLLVSNIATPREREVSREAARQAGWNLDFWKGRHNAVGNNLLVNDKAALVNPRIAPSGLGQIEATLGVEAFREPLAQVETVGMAGVVTSKGMVVHARATQEEMALLAERFGVTPQRATVNFGLPLVGAGLAANSKGAVCGQLTTGIELGRIEDGLGLY